MPRGVSPESRNNPRTEQMALLSPHLSPEVANESLGINGLQYRSSLLTAAEQSQILATIDSQPWQRDLKRRVQHYGYPYDYKSRRLDRSMHLGELPVFVIEVAQ